MSERRKRISIDLDHYHLEENRFGVLRAFFTLKNLFPHATITVERTSGKNFHIKAVGDGIPAVPIVKRIDLREALGDDPLRIDYERIKIRLGLDFLVDTLFTLKHHRGQITKAEPENPLALPWVSQVPASKL